MNKSITIFNNDCFDVFNKFEDSTINLFILDLPYNCLDVEWDKDIIDLNKMWLEIKRLKTNNALIIFFCTSKFGYTLINSNPRWFKYDLVWNKYPNGGGIGHLNAKKMPMRAHEMIYIFGNNNSEAYDNILVNDLTKYAEKVFIFIDKKKSIINKILGHRKAEHFLRFNNRQFSLCTENTYNELIKHFDINNMVGFLEYDELVKLNITMGSTPSTYNVQKTKGHSKRILTKESRGKPNLYQQNESIKPANKIESTERYPNSILSYKARTKKRHHITEKPVDLLEWLILSYSNENDNVMDFTMGSGSVGVACMNLNRNFIGIEKDESIFRVAETRLNEHYEGLDGVFKTT